MWTLWTSSFFPPKSSVAISVTQNNSIFPSFLHLILHSKSSWSPHMTAHFLQPLTGSLLFLWHPACLTVLSDLLLPDHTFLRCDHISLCFFNLFFQCFLTCFSCSCHLYFPSLFCFFQFLTQLWRKVFYTIHIQSKGFQYYFLVRCYCMIQTVYIV